MSTNASATLITALENSLADGDAGWTVTSVTDSSTTRVSGVTGSVSGGNGSVTDSVETRHTLIMELTSPAVRRAVGSSSSARFTYRSIKLGSSFSEAFITINGAELRTTDASLEASLRSLASDFVAATDAAVIDALDAGPQTAGDPLEIPVDLLAALIASLEDEAKAWRAKARIENSSTDSVTITLNLMSLVARLTLGSIVPAQINWIGRFDPFGTLLEGRVFIDGAEWRTIDATLAALVMALGDDYLATRSVSLTAALEA